MSQERLEFKKELDLELDFILKGQRSSSLGAHVHPILVNAKSKKSLERLSLHLAQTSSCSDATY